MGRARESVDGKYQEETQSGTKWREGAFLLNWLGRILAELVKKRVQKEVQESKWKCPRLLIRH